MANTSCLLNSFLRELADGCTDTHFALTVLTDLMAQAATQNRDAVIENHGIIALGTRRSGDCSAAPMPLPAINLPRPVIERMADLVMQEHLQAESEHECVV